MVKKSKKITEECNEKDNILKRTKKTLEMKTKKFKNEKVRAEKF